MKCKLLLSFVFLYLGTLVFAQKVSQEDYLSDLSYIYKNLQETPSFKVQKSKHDPISDLYHVLLGETKGEMYLIDAMESYYKLLDALDDLHNEITSHSDQYTYKDLQDPQMLNKLLLATDGFYRKSNLNLDSLEIVLSTRPINDYEGIYTYNDLIKVAVVKNADKLIGIVLASKIPSWSKAEVMFYLIPKGNDNFRMITGRFVDKQLISSWDYFRNAEFLKFGWRKEHVDTRYYHGEIDSEPYSVKHISPSISYFKISTFYTSNKILNIAKEFYRSIVDHGLPEYLIVDLRNNGGGGDKNSNLLYKILSKHKGVIYLLTNYNTMSNAEQFVLKMKKLPNVHVLGDKTAGVLTFGRNFSKSLLTPSKRFKISFTDLKENWSRYIPYERVGVNPDIYLASDQDWLDQTLEIIHSQKNH